MSTLLVDSLICSAVSDAELDTLCRIVELGTGRGSA